MAKAKSTSKARRKPKFKALWSKDEGLAAVNDALRLDHPTAAGERLAAILLSAPMGEKLLDEEAYMLMLRTLVDARDALKLRMELCHEAASRLAATTEYQLGREATEAAGHG